MSRRRRIAVITGTRAEWGLLEPVMSAIRKRRRLDARVIVTGMHLLKKFGSTVELIRAAGWPIAAEIKMQTGRDSAAAESTALARGIAGIGTALETMNAEIVVVLGDRIEAFAGACAATVSRRILAHIHGGDRAPGDVDETLRNAITRLAQVHLAASRDAAARLRKMGEDPKRIHVVGAPGLDDIRAFLAGEGKDGRATDAWLAIQLGPLAERPYAVVVQHPYGRTAEAEARTMQNILRAVRRGGLAGVAIYPNSDPGHGGIVRELAGLKKDPHWRVFRSLPRWDYLRLLSRAAVMVGNSSGGIIESASLGLKAVNVGPRQHGRLRCGKNVIDVGESAAGILRGLRRALSEPGVRPGGSVSVYGDGRAGSGIARILEELIITPALRRKSLTF